MRRFLLFFVTAFSMLGQTLIVGTGGGLGNSIVTIPLTLGGGTGAIALQWTIKYVKTLTVTVGPTGQGIAAGKVAYSRTTGTSVITQVSMLVGPNTNSISDGTVANLYVTLPTNFTGSAALAISGAVGVSSQDFASGIAFTGASGKVVSSQGQLREKEPQGIVEFPELTSLTCEAAKVKEGREDERSVRCILDLGSSLKRPLRSLAFSNVATVDLPREESIFAAGTSRAIFDIPLRNWSEGLSVLLGLKLTDPEDPLKSDVLITKVVKASDE